MGRIVLEIEHPGMPHAEFRAFEREEVTIGRAFDNDLILSDSFVDPRHLTITLKAGIWECLDHGTVNGTHFSVVGGDIKKRLAVGPLHSGDQLVIGKTLITVWAVDHPVAPAIVVDRAASELYVDRAKMLRERVATFVGFFLLTGLVVHITDWRTDTTWLKVLAGIVVYFIPFLVWAGMWALITKFSKKQHRFVQHLTLACRWALWSALLGFLAGYLAFWIADAYLSLLMFMSLFGVLFFLFLKKHLSMATNMSYAGQRWLAGILSGVVVLSFLLFFHIDRNEVKLEPSHVFFLAPAPAWAIPADSIDDVVARVKKLF